MSRRLTCLMAGGCTILLVAYGVAGSAQQPPAAASRPAASQPAAEPVSPAAAHQAVLSKYCYTCHNDRLKSGGLALTALDISAPAGNSDAWERVIRKLETGAMPPAG